MFRDGPIHVGTVGIRAADACAMAAFRIRTELPVAGAAGRASIESTIIPARWKPVILVEGQCWLMVTIVSTVAYLGLEARAIEVQCQVAPGLPGFTIVGLPDKAVAESRERVRAAISTCRLPICRRKDRTTTCRSRLRCLVQWV
jgi:Subunit ChlI of Mg-chelatase